jgi:replicative DNA helicase
MKKQIVPHAAEVEAAVLGALMSEPGMIDEIAGLNADLFFTPAHAQVFGVIRDIRSAGGVPNIIAVTQVLASHDRLEFVGGAGAVTDMVNHTAGGPAAVEYHVQTLRDLHARRAILHAASRLSSAASDMSQPADDVLQDAGESVLSLSLGQSTDSMRPASAIVPGLLEELEKLMIPGQKLGVETGFKAFDYMTGGLRPGQLTIVAGRPAMGKSALMLNMCENMIRRGVPALYFSLEMPANELGCRVVLGRAETNIEVIRNGFLDHASKLRITQAADQFASEPLYVDDRGGLTMLDGGTADDKILAVLKDDAVWGSARAIEDLPAALVERLVHYFSTYKMRPGHPSAAEVLGTYGVAHAHAVIAASIRDYDRAIANVTVR